MARRSLLIDASAAVNQGAGIGRYSRELIKAAAPGIARAFDLTVWYAAERRGSPFLADLAAGLPAGFGSFRRSRFNRRRVDQLARVPLEIPAWVFGARSDIAYSPDFTLPGTTPGPSMVTIHDLAFEMIPDAYPPGLLAYLKHVVPVNARRSTRVAVVSRTTRIDVVERYNIPADQVVVIPNAADQRFFSAEPLGRERRLELAVPEDYVLTVGTVEPRKNYANLLTAQLRAFELTRRPLVVVGRSGWQNHAEMRQLNDLVDRGAAVSLLNASDDDLPGLYAGARSVIYVPRYEGFGLPVLEAMASGAPVITSDIPSVREIAAGFATVVAPGSIDEIAGALEAIGEDSVDQISLRREAAARYSWTASGTILQETLHAMAV